MEIALHTKYSVVLLPEMITINNVSLLNDEINSRNSVLVLDLGFVA